MVHTPLPELQFIVTDKPQLGAVAAELAAGLAAGHDGAHLVLDGDGVLHRGRRYEDGPVEVEVLLAGGKRTGAQVELADLLEGWGAGDQAAGKKLAEHSQAQVLRFLASTPPGTRAAGEQIPASVPATSVPARASGKPPFTGAPAQIAALRPHVISMARGAFEDDIMDTTPAEVARIADRIAAASAEGKTIVFYAHGGLVSERAALASAWAYHDWWLAHDCYPVFFVWKTGALETLWQLVMAKLGRSRAATRDVFDYTTDPLVEAIAQLPGTVEWRAMKESARLASEEGGGAALLADEIRARLGDGRYAFAAVGHSAGSIFHAHFLPQLTARGFRIDHLALLAPAITHRLYDKTLKGLARKTCMFAMDRATERADNCGGIYRKSLLYLVSRAFETDADKAILGMEDFWPGATDNGMDAVFGPTDPDAPPTRASGSISHGGFDDDRRTMESVLRRIRNIPDEQSLDPRFPEALPAVARAAPAPPNFYGFPEDVILGGSATIAGPLPTATAAPLAYPAGQPVIFGGGGKRFALCIGNNAFGGVNDLAGCIADAHAWDAALRSLGFEAKVVSDATADRMRAEMRAALAPCVQGDVVVLHTSSHGTQVYDKDGDERSDPYLPDTLDEVLLGCDWESGGAIVDDEVPDLLAARPGVRIIRINDFCHAGTASRMLLDRGVRVRRMNLTPAQQQRIGDVNAGRQRTRGIDLGESLNLVALSACRPEQTAGEADGMGLFSRAALELLAGAGRGMSGDQFMAEIARRFESRQQTPIIEGPARLRALPLFGGGLS